MKFNVIINIEIFISFSCPEPMPATLKSHHKVHLLPTKSNWARGLWAEDTRTGPR